jgi:adapter protein MecA 1/2
MMEQAYSELGFDASGPLAVEVFALPAQGMVVIVTKSRMNASHHPNNIEEDEDEDVYEMEVTLEQSDLISYAFHDFEDLLSMAKVINPLLVDGGILFSYQGKWILQLEPVDMEEKESRYQALIAVLSEYGEATSVTRAVLEEYGKIIIADDAVKVLCSYF